MLRTLHGGIWTVWLYIYRVHFKFRFNEQYCHQKVFKFKLIILWIVLIFFSTYKLVLKKKVRQSKRKIHLILQDILRFFLVSMKTFLGIFRHSLFFKHHAGQNDFNFQHFQKFTKYRSDKPANNLPEPLPIVSVLHGPGSYSLWTEFMIFRSALSFSWIVIYLKIHVTVVCVLKSQWVMQVLHWHLRITLYYVFISFQ